MEVLLQMMHQLDIVTHINTSSSACLQQVLLLSSLLLAHCRNMHSNTAHGATLVFETAANAPISSSAALVNKVQIL